MTPDQNPVASIADASKPNAGRIYDYVLGGDHNFEVDRVAAQQILKILPDYPQLARYVRWFLGEAVRRLSAKGFTRFIDFASGLPTLDHIHSITPPGTKVVYSDIDPVTVAYGQDIVKDVPDARYVACDAAEPEKLLTSQLVAEFLGPSHKVAIGFNGIAFFLKDEQIAHAMKALYEWAEKGSCLFLCDFDNTPPAGKPSPEIEGSKFWEKVGQPLYLHPVKKLRELVAPWKEWEGGFRSAREWFGIEMREEDKKTVFADLFVAVILEK